MVPGYTSGPPDCHYRDSVCDFCMFGKGRKQKASVFISCGNSLYYNSEQNRSRKKSHNDPLLVLSALYDGYLFSQNDPEQYPTVCSPWYDPDPDPSQMDNSPDTGFYFLSH